MNTHERLKNYDSLIIVAGLSGAGKSTAMHLLSDSGYYVVDNLPVPLLDSFLQLSESKESRFKKTALLLDITSEDHQEKVLGMVGVASKRPPNVQVVFLDADTKSITRRYSETRRPHPHFDATIDSSLADTIDRERSVLQTVKETANLILDTSAYTVHSLKRHLRDFLQSLGTVSECTLRVNFLSFGFKKGAPIDCDLIADVRFLRNPYFVEALREQTGKDAPVRDYVFESSDASDFVKQYASLLQFLLPRYQFEGKAYLNVGIGCTGGQHRSVAIAEELAKTFQDSDYLISIRHRDARFNTSA